MSEILYETLYTIDSIITIILKLMGLIAIHIWVVFNRTKAKEQ
tara:strand:+ start:1634 stop:1762 length:129 start_codon:yes stop_codon:yes gene_type:complete